jgi:hypothetical protein
MKPDVEAIRLAIVTQLPLRARWRIYDTPLDYDFGVARRDLRELPRDAIASGDVRFFDLLIFGDYDCAEGGGAHPWLGIRKTDGAVYGLDPEREDPLFFLNSSIEEFIQTFALLNEYLGKGKELPFDLEDRVRNIDPEAYPESDWRLLVEHIADAKG